MSSKETTPKKKGPSRLARTLRSLLFMIGVGVVLAAYNAYGQHRDLGLAIGPVGPSQRDFFIDSVDRPDIDLFFKGLTSQQRRVMAERIGEYDDPRLAKLIGKLLGTFDPAARTELTESLVHVGRKDPQVVADQMTVKGSLQQLAVANALKQLGTPAFSAVAKMLSNADARPNAVAYLVSAGAPSVPYVLPLLEDKVADVRLAAADTLGKIGARAAVPRLLALYRGSTGDEQFGYLSALSGIGAPEAEEILTKQASDESIAGPRRAQAMLGLGRIRSESSIATLWRLDTVDDPQIHDAVISGLQLAGDRAIETAPDLPSGLRVASGVKTPEADAYIAKALANPSTRDLAADAAANRPTLVPALTRAAKGASNGAVADAVMRSLATTPEGLTELRTLAADPAVGGFAVRRLRLAGQAG